MRKERGIQPRALLTLAAAALVAVAAPAVAGNWNVKDTAELIAAMNAANQFGGANVITLTGGGVFTLTDVNNETDGPTGLPVITAGNNLTVLGNSASIARSTALGTPAFRLFYVQPAASLTLQNVTLANGLVVGQTAMNSQGGAVYNAAGASLTIKNCALSENRVIGGDGGQKPGGWGLGGALWIGGEALLEHTTFSGNQAMGGATRNANSKGFGGGAFGGAAASGNSTTLTVNDCIFTGNKAIGGLRHKPSSLFDGIGGSGAIDTWGTAVITGTTFADNQAMGGPADPGVDGGYSVGGALGSGGPMAVDAICRVQHCTFNHNQAIGGDAGSPETLAGDGIAGALSSGYTRHTALMTLTDCSFAGNEALGGQGGGGGKGNGGAINQESPPPNIPGQSTLIIAGSSFTGNRAVARGLGGAGFGGAIVNSDWNMGDGSGAILQISDCSFNGNETLGAAGANGIDDGGFGQGGAINTTGNTTILSSTFEGNRALGGPLQHGARANFFTASDGGAIALWNAGLEVRDSAFFRNDVVGGDNSLGGAPSVGLGGAIAVTQGSSPAKIVNCSLMNNTAAGGAGGSGVPGAAGVGGGMALGASIVTVTGTVISYNQALGGAAEGPGLGGGCAVGFGVLFGLPDPSMITLEGGSVVTHNQPDDVFQFR